MSEEEKVAYMDEGKIISIVEQVQTRPTRKVGSRRIFHQPPTAGITQRQTEEEVRYVGMVFTVPVEDLAKFRDSCDRQVNRIFLNSHLDQAGYTPVRNGIIERYEAYDMNRTMVYIMYRVPCMPTSQKAG
ncbi:MAG: hypothetical protein SWE60_04100 [Thermodesulfobacteriota bacterium]|nr:hypothetical protein [Thermodesulfobacteriota bacterium]